MLLHKIKCIKQAHLGNIPKTHCLIKQSVQFQTTELHLNLVTVDIETLKCDFKLRQLDV